MLTIFSAPKAFTDEHIAKIQRNALRSWLKLGDAVEVLLLGDEPGIKESAEAFGVRCIPVRSRSASGAPLINDLFALARQHAKHYTLCYLNADIILMEDFLPSIQVVLEKFPAFLIVGNRYDLEIHDELQMQDDWHEDLRRMVREVGKPHPPMGSDYFVYRKGQFTDMPSFALGRAGWDNWMMYKARHMRIPLVDASAVITAIHQDHDYAHLPGGEPHYRHPESNRNINLAGGYETMFRLRDANWMLIPEGLRQKGFKDWEWPRKIEADLIAGSGAGVVARLTRMLFHPRAALVYLRHKFGRSAQEPSLPSSGDRETSS
jgi:hypothetical protein